VPSRAPAPLLMQCPRALPATTAVTVVKHHTSSNKPDHSPTSLEVLKAAPMQYTWGDSAAGAGSDASSSSAGMTSACCSTHAEVSHHATSNGSNLEDDKVFAVDVYTYLHQVDANMRTSSGM